MNKKKRIIVLIIGPVLYLLCMFAIPVGHGLQPKYMLKEGYKITILVILSMTALCYVMLKYWPAFSTV